MDIFWFLGLAALNFVLSLLVAIAARERGRSEVGFFFISMFLSFLVALLLLVAFPITREPAQGHRHNCPVCDEPISPRAQLCRFCKSEVASHFQAIKDAQEASQRSELEKARRDELKRQEALALQRDKRSAQMRRFFASKLGGRVLPAILLMGLVGVGFAVVSEVSKDNELRNLTCEIDPDTLGMQFGQDMNLTFSLGRECLDRHASALDRGIITRGKLRAFVKVEVYLDQTLVYKNSILQRFVSRAQMPVIIDSSLFQKYSKDTGKVAREYKATLTYTNAFSTSQSFILRGAIPVTKPQVSLDAKNCPTYKDVCIIVINYENYQMPDSILFDYPGEESDFKEPSGATYHFADYAKNKSVVVSVLQAQSVVDKFVVKLK